MTKMIKFVGSGSVKYTMEKKDIIILVAVLACPCVLTSIGGMPEEERRSRKLVPKKTGEKSSLSGQPDDYEPYSGKIAG